MRPSFLRAGRQHPLYYLGHPENVRDQLLALFDVLS